MRKLDIPGGWYCDCRVDGAYAVLVPGAHIQTHQGNFALPGHNLLFPRIPPQGPFKIAGQHQAGAGNLEWADGAWRNAGPSFGVAPVIYGWSGTLFQNTGSAGSQGFRFVDPVTDRIWTGDETYAGELAEWTRMSDVTIGFADPPAVYVLMGGQRRVLLHGTAQRVNYTRIGDQHAIAIACPDKAVLVWMTTTELRELPLASPQPPQPPQPPEPPQPPTTMRFTDAQKQTLIAIGEKFPDLRRSPDDEQRRAFNMRLAQQFRHSYGERWGTKRADPGRPLSKDAIAFKNGDGFFSFDTVNGTTREVNPEAEGEFLTDQVYVPVEPHDWLGDEPEPPDTPVPPTPNLEPRVAALEASFAMAQGRVDLLTDRVAVLENEEPPAGVSEARVQELIAAALTGLKVEGSTSRSLAHSHSVSLKVTRG